MPSAPRVCGGLKGLAPTLGGGALPLFTELPRGVLLANLTTLSLGASPLQNASQAHEKHLVEARLSKKMRRAAPAGIIPSGAGVR